MTNNNIDWIFPILRKPTRLWNIGSTVTVSAVGLLNKFLISCLNTRRVFNKEHLYQALERPAHIPLITVSNHHSCLDDPGIWGATLRGWKHLCDRNVMRWSLAAHDICFTNKLHSYFFMLGKCVPVIRGAGVDQDAIHFCQEKLALGHWVHIFPEGGVNMTHEPKRFKWGVGKLVWDCDVLPIVIPMWHVGMETILPNVEPYTPQIGKKVTINIGKPIQLGDLVSSLRRSQADPVTARKSITDVIQHEVMSLKPITEKLHSGWACSGMVKLWQRDYSWYSPGQKDCFASLFLLAAACYLSSLIRASLLPLSPFEHSFWPRLYLDCYFFIFFIIIITQTSCYRNEKC